MNLVALFFTALAVGFSGALTPGPLLSAVVSQTVERGPGGGLGAVAGHGLLELAMVAALAAGAGQWLALREVSGAIGLAGGLVLLAMGWGMVRGAARLSRSLDLVAAAPAGPSAGRRLLRPGPGWPEARARAGVTGRGLSPLWLGVMTSVANPYWTLWWATVGAGYLALAGNRGAAGAGVFFLGHFLSDFSWYALVTAAVAGGRRVLPHRFYRGLLAVCGVFLMVMGGSFLVYGGLRLLRPAG
ncbi:MAG: LysE family translocator [Acetobacteraceae bacterium]|nr:LysE family translocator [Acetobacteraceae bacterium]